MPLPPSTPIMQRASLDQQAGRARFLGQLTAIGVVALATCFPAKAQQDAAGDAARKKASESTALDRMRHRAHSLVLQRGGEDANAGVSLVDKPLLHYSDPGGYAKSPVRVASA